MVAEPTNSIIAELPISGEFLQILDNLPSSQQQVLMEYANYLAHKYAQNQPSKKKKRQAGTFQGYLVFMAEDFNAPLDEFKEYMA